MKKNWVSVFVILSGFFLVNPCQIAFSNSETAPKQHEDKNLSNGHGVGSHEAEPLVDEPELKEGHGATHDKSAQNKEDNKEKGDVKIEEESNSTGSDEIKAEGASEESAKSHTNKVDTNKIGTGFLWFGAVFCVLFFAFFVMI